jgi:phospholipase A1/A2
MPGASWDWAASLRRPGACAALACAVLALAPGHAAAKDVGDCAGLDSERQRLRCYDEIAKPGAEVPDRNSYLVRSWKLGAAEVPRLGAIEEYRPTYFLLWRKSNDPNTLPGTPAAGHTAAEPLALDASEAKFQLSFKTELARSTRVDVETANEYGFHRFRLWAAYTQQSSWQWFNRSGSRPFRETDYEPELVATFDRHVGGAGLKMVNFGLVHQSNGRDDPFSRSWNRVYVQGGWEWPVYRLAVLARLWARLDTSRHDDNPDIVKYLGHGDLVARWESQENCAVEAANDRCHRVWATFRPNPGHGFLQIDWATAWRIGLARFHVQVTTGYGESLIDYNHAQTTYGFGFSVGDW